MRAAPAHTMGATLTVGGMTCPVEDSGYDLIDIEVRPGA